MAVKRDLSNKGTADCPIVFYEFWKRKPTTEPQTHCHSEIEILIPTQNSLEVILEDAIHTVHPGQLFLLDPMLPHRLHIPSPDTRWGALMFSREAIDLPQRHILTQSFVEPIFSGALQLPRIITKEHPVYEEITAIVCQLPENRAFTQGYKLRRFALVIQLCTLLVPYCTSGTPYLPDGMPNQHQMRQLIIYIHQHLSEPLSLDSLAAQLHLHPNYLCALFKKYMKTTVFQYIALRRVQHAATLLRNEDIPVGEITGLVGFPNETAFFQNFKKNMGVTPLKYRKQFLSNG